MSINRSFAFATDTLSVDPPSFSPSAEVSIVKRRLCIKTGRIDGQIDGQIDAPGSW